MKACGPSLAELTHLSRTQFSITAQCGVWEPGVTLYSSVSPKHKHLCPTITTSTAQRPPMILSLSWNLSFSFYFYFCRSLQEDIFGGPPLLPCLLQSSSWRASYRRGECFFLSLDLSLTSGLLFPDQGLCCPCSNSAGIFSNNGAPCPLRHQLQPIPFITQ